MFNFTSVTDPMNEVEAVLTYLEDLVQTAPDNKDTILGISDVKGIAITSTDVVALIVPGKPLIPVSLQGDGIKRSDLPMVTIFNSNSVTMRSVRAFNQKCAKEGYRFSINKFTKI